MCSPQIVHRYLSKISGPLLDRIDIHIEVTPVSYEELSNEEDGEKSVTILERVVQARQIQQERYEKNVDIHSNAQMASNQISMYCGINHTGQILLKTAMKKLNLSARAYDRILKVSRTIADLDNSKTIEIEHLAEAIQYRSLDREEWGGL